jgi:membrane dipeptidase
LIRTVQRVSHYFTAFPLASFAAIVDESAMTSSAPVPIFDGHNDVLLRLHRRSGGDPVEAFLQGEEAGQLDLVKARIGGLAGGLFAIFVPPVRRKATSDSQNSLTSTDAPSVDLAEAQRVTFAMAALLLRIERESQGRVRICRDAADIEHCLANDTLATVLHIEGAEAIDDNFDVLNVLHAAGLRSLGPVWSRPNAFGYGVPFRCPSSPDTGPGLTDLGKALVAECNRLRIMIDLSHLNEKGFWDVAALSNAPLVATHSNAHAISPHSRNLTDKQLAAIRESGGMVGVNYATSFLRPDGKQDKDTPADLIIQHAQYLLDHLGEDSVGLGSDFDGATIPAELGSAAGLQILVEKMRERQFGQALIEKVCFRNWLRVLGKTWQAA